MTRNWNIIRDLLKYFERKHMQRKTLNPFDMLHHVELVFEAGYVEVVSLEDSISEEHRRCVLTPKGQKMLQLMASDAVWKRAMARLSIMGTNGITNATEKQLVDMFSALDRTEDTIKLRNEAEAHREEAAFLEERIAELEAEGSE